MTAAILAAALATVAAQGQSASPWLDRPLTSWNTAGAAIPAAPTSAEATAAVIARCKLDPPRSTAGEQALDAAGWIPFWNFDQQIVHGDVEIVGGMREADGMCRPLAYNLFVFVEKRFAGTLSPTLMSSRLDASSGVVRAAPPLVTTEFARYGPSDPLCCPSSRVTVRYRIDRTPAGPVVVPEEIRTTRP